MFGKLQLRRNKMNALFTKIRRIYRFYTVLTHPQREWVRDLRSGKFKRGTGSLQTGDYFCCLGVAVKTCERLTGYFPVVYHEKLLGSFLSDQPWVGKWLGMASFDGKFGDQSLTILNDGTPTTRPHNFREIADVIIDNAETLFVRKEK
jgi:hypothetical protein